MGMCYYNSVKREHHSTSRARVLRDTRPPKSDAPQQRRRSREKVFEKGCDFSKIPLDNSPKLWYNKDVKRKERVPSLGKVPLTVKRKRSTTTQTGKSQEKKCKKPLDKPLKVWYNKGTKEVLDWFLDAKRFDSALQIWAERMVVRIHLPLKKNQKTPWQVKRLVI